MKADTLIILGAAAAALAVVYKLTRKAGTTGTAQSINNNGAVNAIGNTALPGGAGWGWQYFSDGTSIGPDGSYYQGGTKVWSPT